MAKKKNHETVGVDSEVQELFMEGEEEGQEETPFLLPERRPNKLLPVQTEKDDTTEDEKIEKDAEYARNNIYELIEHGMAAIQDMSHLSREQMHPRTYEVFSKLLKDVADSNVTLLELIDKKKKAKRKEAGNNPNTQPTVNNIDKAVFVGTTNDLLKAMAEAEKQNGRN